MQPKKETGFTLIELSIVLIIIGLIAGGILVGRDLIDVATQRAQISQIEKYNTAVYTFLGKYGYLPGDIPNPAASGFGFQARGTHAGEGDGSGVIEGNCADTANGNNGFQLGCGETAVFWQDLSTAGLIDGVSPYTGQTYPSTTAPTTTWLPALYTWFPNTKIGRNTNILYVYSRSGINYFAISAPNRISWYLVGSGSPGVTVQQAYNIDNKVDDGLPQSGNVSACYLDNGILSNSNIWAAGGGQQGVGGVNCVPTTTATAPAATDCYGNNNIAGTMTYSVSTNATLSNCALSFKFQ